MRKSIKGCLSLLMILLCFPLLPQILRAQSTASVAEAFNTLSPDQQKLVNDIADQLRCPTCTGLSINQSDAPFSLQIRQAVIGQVLEGQHKKEILDFFTERYGLWILREPPAKGFHFLAWLIPLLAMLLGPCLIWFFIIRKKQEGRVFHGIRSADEIFAEMDEQLTSLRKSGTGKQSGGING